MNQDDFPKRNGRSDDVTRRTRAITEVEMRSYELESRAQRAEKSIKQIKFWVQTALGLASAVAIGAFMVARWMNNVAHTEEVSSISTRVTVVETKLDVMTKMMELTVQQGKEIARAVHAPMVVQPEHIALTPPGTEPKK